MILASPRAEIARRIAVAACSAAARPNVILSLNNLMSMARSDDRDMETANYTSQSLALMLMQTKILRRENEQPVSKHERPALLYQLQPEATLEIRDENVCPDSCCLHS